jgi:hypothetical protein
MMSMPQGSVIGNHHEIELMDAGCARTLSFVAANLDLSDSHVPVCRRHADWSVKWPFSTMAHLRSYSPADKRRG